VGERLIREHLDARVDVNTGAAREIGRLLATPVEHHERAAIERRRERGRRGVCDVVAHEPHLARVEPRDRALEEERRAARVQRAQPFPVVGEEVDRRFGRFEQPGVVRIGDGVEIGGVDAGVVEAPRRRRGRDLPRRERHGFLAVLASAETLLFGSRDDLPVDDERRGRVVEHGVDPENDCQERLLGPGAAGERRLPKQKRF
jgi:hypothetical protein